MKTKLLVVLLLVCQLGYSQGFLTKAIAKVAKKVGAGNDQMTSTLTDVDATVGIGSNLHPAELGTISQSFFNGWKPGGDLVFLMFTKKTAPGFYKIDGTVNVNGVPVEYLTSGMYSIITEANPAARNVDITTSGGQKSSFTIEPAKNIVKILSINGQKDNIAVDLTKDVTLELETNVPSSDLLKVSIAINQISIKSIYDVCFIRSGSKLVIPAAAFRNIAIKPAGDAVYNYKKSFIQVGYESLESATNVTGDLKDVKYTRVYNDGKFVNVTAEPNLNLGMNVTGTEANMNYDIARQNAFSSMPFETLKKVGVVSLAIRGTTYHQVSQSTSSGPMKINPFGGASSSKTTTTVTITKEFPYESFLEKLYPELMEVVTSEFGAAEIPVDKITSSEAYQSMQSYSNDDANTTVDFAKPYRNTKVISALSIAESTGANSVVQRVIKETGADALMTLTLDLETTENGKEVQMSPKLIFEIAGKANGSVNTKYCTGTVKSASGVVFSSSSTPEQIEGIIRRADLVSAFRRGLHEMIEKAKANGDYVTVWKLQE